MRREDTEGRPRLRSQVTERESGQGRVQRANKTKNSGSRKGKRKVQPRANKYRAAHDCNENRDDMKERGEETEF